MPKLPSILRNHLKVVKYDLPTLKNIVISNPPV